jgi:multiple sugar transport system ATP-binding protein
MAEVVLEQVTKTFPNGVTAVRDLSLAVAHGELVALVGPSGGGKTTLLRLIAGLEQPTAGTVRLAGRVANALPPRARQVALVFQKHSLFPHLSVRENLAFGLRMERSTGWLPRWFRPAQAADRCRGNQVIADRVAEAARLLGLEDVLDRLPAQLSGGQQQRVALGRAVVRQPAVFLLDEPLSHLDARLRADMRRQLHLLHQRLQATIIYVTHDQVEAMTLGQRLLVLHQGVLQQAGPPGLIYRHPRNRFVAGFLGWPPMNLVDGRLVRVDGQIFFSAGRQQVPLNLYNNWDYGHYLERSVTFGIRPEHVSLLRERASEARLAMEVVLVEPLGSECLVTFQHDAWQLTAKMDGRLDPMQGQTVEVALDMEQVHLFDSVSGVALAPRALGGSDPTG